MVGGMQQTAEPRIVSTRSIVVHFCCCWFS